MSSLLYIFVENPLIYIALPAETRYNNFKSQWYQAPPARESEPLAAEPGAGTGARARWDLHGQTAGALHPHTVLPEQV